jgi:hypothetical protein
MNDPRHRRVALALRILGTLDLLALVAALAPRPWLVVAHEWCGLGSLPDGPVVGYLYRSASAMYALHGALMLFVAGDVVRYWRLIRFLAMLAVVHGAVLVAIDAAEQMPGWWRWIEGPGFAATGAVVLWLQRRGGAGDTATPDRGQITDKAPTAGEW